MTTYDQGFNDGLKWVVNILKHSAFIVEQTKYGDFEGRNGGPPVRAIVAVGQVSFAKRLRDVAQVIEEALASSPPETF